MPSAKTGPDVSTHWIWVEKFVHVNQLTVGLRLLSRERFQIDRVTHHGVAGVVGMQMADKRPNDLAWHKFTARGTFRQAIVKPYAGSGGVVDRQ